MSGEWPQFEWSARKAAENLRKHGVAFELAAEAFFDPAALYEDDPYSTGEYREVVIGASPGGLLFVVFVERHGAVIRIISARLATPHEKRRYRQIR